MERKIAIKKAGEILRSLNPTTIGVLLLVIDDKIEKQVEMAEILGCTSAPISLSLREMAEMEEPLVKKDRDYHITTMGTKVISNLDQMLISLDIDLCDIEWSNDDDKDQVGQALRPLHNSRSMIPFYILDTLSDNVLNGNSPTASVDVIASETDEISRRQVTQSLSRFEKEDAARVNSGDVTIEKKGREQVRLFNHLVDFLLEDEPNHSPPDRNGEDKIQIPMEITIGELSDRIQQMEEKYGRDEILQIQWSFKLMCAND